MADHMKEMEKEIEEDRRQGIRRKLLLHACCAPCSSGCLSAICPHFHVSIYFFNPNISSLEEYERRYREEERFLEILKENGEEGAEELSLTDPGYDHGEWLLAVKGLENEPERGRRCEACFRMRLEKTFMEAASKGYDCVTTTLTLSPLKDANLINRIGTELSEKYNVHWLPSDFKKRDGFLKSVRLSEKYGLYRQDFCGCEFSKRERNEKSDRIVE
ncbi:MAG: epoxyqueuosine reductase QueH [Lachnospiraceae bacterium]|nr:epoxyqueuosine reductase QueH [Lachnospiraceae bacterium]